MVVTVMSQVSADCCIHLAHSFSMLVTMAVASASDTYTGIDDIPVFSTIMGSDASLRHRSTIQLLYDSGSYAAAYKPSLAMAIAK